MPRLEIITAFVHVRTNGYIFRQYQPVMVVEPGQCMNSLRGVSILYHMVEQRIS